MLIFISFIILVMSSIFVRLLHPLSMGLVLLVQTSLITMSSGMMNLSFWFSYILFLIYLGGMLVLFIYVASLASNEIFEFSGSWSFTIGGLSLFSLIFFLLNYLEVPVTLKVSSSDVTMFYNNLETISKIYSMPMMNFTLYMIMYLLLTLLAVVKITGKKSSPLRLSAK